MRRTDATDWQTLSRDALLVAMRLPPGTPRGEQHLGAIGADLIRDLCEDTDEPCDHVRVRKALDEIKEKVGLTTGRFKHGMRGQRTQYSIREEIWPEFSAWLQGRIEGNNNSESP